MKKRKSLSLRGIPPGDYIMTLEASGVFFGADYELELDQGNLQVLLPVAIPGTGSVARLLLVLLMALSGLWILRRSM